LGHAAFVSYLNSKFNKQVHSMQNDDTVHFKVSDSFSNQTWQVLQAKVDQDSQLASQVQALTQVVRSLAQQLDVLKQIVVESGKQDEYRLRRT